MNKKDVCLKIKLSASRFMNIEFNMVGFWKHLAPNEPYRVILADVRDKLYETRERCRHMLADGTSDISEEGTYTNAEQVVLLKLIAKYLKF